MNSDFKDLLRLFATHEVQNRVTDEAEGFPIHFLSRSDLIRAKQEAGRPQDLADLDEIRRAEEKDGGRSA